MPVFIAALLGGLVSAAGSFVGRVLIALGVGFVSYTGVDLALDQFRTAFLTGSTALPPQVIGMLGLLKIGTCFNILSSSVTARLVLNGLTSGTIKRMVIK